MQRTMKCRIPLLLAALLLAGPIVVVGIPAALAHAFLDRASPAVGSTVHTPPSEVRIRFTEELEPAFSSIGVLDPQGRHVEQGKAKADPGDRKVLEVSLPALPPGTYKVIWRVISVDTHRTEGDFTFVVSP